MVHGESSVEAALRPGEPPYLNRFILVNKAARTLTLIENGEAGASFPVLIGKNPGPKERMGDDRTPEGDLHVAQMLPDEAAVGAGYYKGLHISYPHPEHAAVGRSLGLIDEDVEKEVVRAFEAGEITPQVSALGGEVAIHAGLAPDELFVRGTRGCVVMRNADMDVVYAFACQGMRILITPN